MSDLIKAVRANSDMVRATVFTAGFQFDGHIHCPKIGKETRRLTNLLNAGNRSFVAMTDVSVTSRTDTSAKPESYPMVQVSLSAIEFIRPHFDASEVAGEIAE